MTLDIGQDCTAFDGDETLTLLPVADGGKGYDNGIQIADCLGRSPQYRDLQFLGNVSIGSTIRVWHLPVANCGAVEPVIGDRLQQQDAKLTAWRIQSAELQTLATRWRCICTKER